MTRKPHQPPPRVYSYARFSSKEQAKGDSLRRQAAARDAWLAARGLKLDTSLVMTDEGRTGFNRSKEEFDTYALGEFKREVEAGRVEPGSYLLVENLDRLSREDDGVATELFLSIVNKGVIIVQLSPEVTEFKRPVNMMSLMRAIIELSRGHSESVMKSDRVGKAWKQRKTNAAATGAPISGVCPGWLEIKGDKYAVKPGAEKAIRFIYRLATEGHGIGAITKRLREDGVQPFPGIPAWAYGYVGMLLRDRRVLGEFQPWTRAGKRRLAPDGPPRAGYYPVIIGEDEWAAAQFAIDGRRIHRGPKGKSEYIFAGLMKEAHSGSPIYRTDKGAGRGTAKLVNADVVKKREGAGGHPSFPAGPFEAELLRHLDEIDPREVLPGADKDLESLRTKYAVAAARVERFKGQMVDGDEDVPDMAGTLRDLVAKRDKAAAAVAEAERDADTPLAAAWSEYATLYDVLKKAKDKKAARVRLRSAVRRMVESVTCLFVGRGLTRLAAVRVDFRGGHHRDYFIAHRNAHGVSGTPARTQSKSFAAAGIPADADLRDPKQAAALEKLLLKHTTETVK